MDYSKFQVKDFICDEYFQNWVIQPGEEINSFWNKWLQENPGKNGIVDQARKILLNISFEEESLTNGQVQSALIKNLSYIDSIEKQQEKKTRIISIHRFKRIRNIAAVFIGILLLSSAFFYYNRINAKTLIATNYGEIKTVMLPDSTEITLNAHSSITYSKHWRNNQPREVRLEGEALFNVKHLNKNKNAIKNPERFIVYTNNVKIEVLGTIFDVKNRREKTDVILKTGKVKIVLNNKKHTDIIMYPGEMIAYEATTDQVKRTITDPVVQTAWVDKKLILENASVNTIVQYLEDNFGYKVILKDTAIGNKKMEGTLMLDNIQDVLFVLSTSLDLKIKKEDSTLIFSR